MPSSSSTWRKHPLKEDQTYLALISFEGFPGSRFEAGTIYRLQSIGYSRYDSSTVFTFLAEGGAQPDQWWWHDEASDDLPSQLFQSIT